MAMAVCLCGSALPAEDRLDAQHLLNMGLATVDHTPLDIGTVGNALDGNAATLARSANINPLVITLQFSQPQIFSSFRTRFLAGLNRWNMEAADTLADLRAATGSYRLLVNGQTGPEQAWSAFALPEPHTARLVRFSLQRLTGDNYVHLTDVEFFQPDERIVLATEVDPIRMVWSGRAGRWYAVERSTDLRSWTEVAYLKAGAISLAWPLGDEAVQTPRFFRVRTARAEERPSLVKKVLVLNYDPILEGHGGVRLHQHFRWNDPRLLTAQYLADLTQVSGGYLGWDVVDFLDIDQWPLKMDGFRYTDLTYLEAWRTNGFHKPDAVDYARIVEDHDLDRRVREGEVEEVILWGFPYAGYYESRMAGATAYWCNAPPLLRTNTPLYVIMGLNYERGVAEALHSFGHRAESILTRVYGSWSSGAQINHLWDRFSRFERNAPGQAACGNVHFPPNGQADYDYGNLISVLSEADNWLGYPNLTGSRRLLDATDWGRTHRGFMKWWFNHMPKVPGRHGDGRLHNWWAYLVDMNEYPEAR